MVKRTHCHYEESLPPALAAVGCTIFSIRLLTVVPPWEKLTIYSKDRRNGFVHARTANRKTRLCHFLTEQKCNQNAKKNMREQKASKEALRKD